MTRLLLKDTPPRPTIKVVVVGPAGVGKTCLCYRYAHRTWIDMVAPTLGSTFCEVEAELCAMRIWDTAGQELYRSITPFYLRGAQAAVVVLDVAASDLPGELTYWKNLVSQAEPRAKIAVALNKADLVDSATTKAALASLRDEELVGVVSAKTGMGVDALFDATGAAALDIPQSDTRAVFSPLREDRKPCCH